MRITSGKKADNFKKQYLESNATDLRYIYKSWSFEKDRAVDGIKAEMRNTGGFDLRLWGGNTFRFSCGYRFLDKRGYEMLKVFTGVNVYYIKM